MIEKTDRQSLYAFCLVFLAAVIVYLQQSWVPGFFQDGYLYAAYGKNAAEKGFWFFSHLSNSTYAEFYQHTPFVFSLEGLFFKIFGASYTTARIFGALFSLLTLLFLNTWIKKNADVKWAWIASVILVLTPPLIKKTRFPNMDTPLMLFVLLAIIFYWDAVFRDKRWRWPLVGLFFGLAMLTKGPMAIFIPLAIFFHLILSGHFKEMLKILPWASFILGILIFMIWPFSLWMIDRLDIFYNYLDSIFVHSIAGGRGVEQYTLFQCVIFLLKYTMPWFLLALFSLFLCIKRERKNPFLLLHACVFLSVLIPLSIVKFKYSHYMMPLYPFMAALAAFPLLRLSDRVYQYIYHFFKIIVLALGLILLVFPVTTKIRRDPEIFKALEIIDILPKKPNAWAIVNDVYPFYSLANLNGWRDHSETFKMNTHTFTKWLKGESIQDDLEMELKMDSSQFRWAFLISSSQFKEIEAQMLDQVRGQLRKLMWIKKKNIILLLDRRLYDDDTLLIYE